MPNTKTIASAIQKGTNVYAYNEKGIHLFNRAGELVGFTSTTVTIKKGSSIVCYDATGKTLFTRSAK
ncbi:putative uncharacterized protein [Acetobacter sp. CAG:267]|nr:putative uncharacterized protein [Acetobacter sp. CAG:267]